MSSKNRWRWKTFGNACGWTVSTRTEKGWAMKRVVRSSSDVWCGEGLERALFPRFRCVWWPAKLTFQQTGNLIFFIYFCSMIKTFFHSPGSELKMFMSACILVNLFHSKLPKNELNLRVSNACSCRKTWHGCLSSSLLQKLQITPSYILHILKADTFYVT